MGHKCFWGEGEEVLLSLVIPSLQRSFEKSEERQNHLPLLAHTPPFFRGDRVVLLAAEDMLSRATTSFWWIRRGSRDGCWSTLKVFSECHRKRESTHYESVLKAYSLLRKGLLKNVGCLPKTDGQSNREIIKALCKDPQSPSFGSGSSGHGVVLALPIEIL